MSWTPYDHEAEERRDSEWFADASVFDGPDPSEYMERDDDELDPDGEPWQWSDIHDVDPEVTNMQHAAYQSIINPKPSMIDENAALKGLLVLLFAILAGLMVWILVGAAVMRWVLR